MGRVHTGQGRRSRFSCPEYPESHRMRPFSTMSSASILWILIFRRNPTQIAHDGHSTGRLVGSRARGSVPPCPAWASKEKSPTQLHLLHLSRRVACFVARAFVYY